MGYGRAASGDTRVSTGAGRNANLRFMKYLTIGEVARLTSVGRSTLRDWEAQGLISADRCGTHRRFSEADIRRIREVATMRARGLNPPAIVELLGRPADATEGKDELDQVNLGGRLRRARHDARLTLKQAAARVGVSFSHLSGIERGVANPSLALLERLGQLYGTPTGAFWGQTRSPSEPVPQHWQEATLLATDRGRVHAYAVARGQTICGDLFEADPGGGSEGQYAHEGEELVYVLEGVLTIWLDGSRRYVIEPGHSLCFRSDVSHRWLNEGPGRLQMLWTSVTPASVARHVGATNGHEEQAAEHPAETRVGAIG